MLHWNGTIGAQTAGPGNETVGATIPIGKRGRMATTTEALKWAFLFFYILLWDANLRALALGTGVVVVV